MLRSMQQIAGSLPAKNPFSMAASDIAAAKAEEERREWSLRIDQANIPKDFLKARLQDCAREVKDWYLGFEAKRSGWLILSGPNGTGKTHQACACAIQAAKITRVQFTTMNGIITRLQSTFNGSEDLDKVLYQLKFTPLLVVDELEKFKATEWSASMAFEIFNVRWANNRPIITTTNLTPKRLFAALNKAAGEELAASFMSRLQDRRNTSVQLTGEDRRRA